MKIADQIFFDLQTLLSFYEKQAADLKAVRGSLINPVSVTYCDELIQQFDRNVEKIKQLIEDNKNLKLRL